MSFYSKSSPRGDVTIGSKEPCFVNIGCKLDFFKNAVPDMIHSFHCIKCLTELPILAPIFLTSWINLNGGYKAVEHSLNEFKTEISSKRVNTPSAHYQCNNWPFSHCFDLDKPFNPGFIWSTRSKMAIKSLN